MSTLERASSFGPNTSTVARVTLEGVPYYVKRIGARRSAGENSAYLGIPSRFGYHPNHPGVERLTYRIGKSRANVAEVLWPFKSGNIRLEKWSRRPYYLSREATSYTPAELPCQTALSAKAAHFVYNVLTRNWDACVTNLAIVCDLPVQYDFGEALNPALFEIGAFVEMISRPHAMGHYCETYLYAASYHAAAKDHLEQALNAFESMKPTPVELAEDEELPESLRDPILSYLEQATKKIRQDVYQVIASV